MSDDEGDERSYDYLAPEVVAARDAVGKAISDYLRAIRPEEDPTLSRGQSPPSGRTPSWS